MSEKIILPVGREYRSLMLFQGGRVIAEIKKRALSVAVAGAIHGFKNQCGGMA